MRMPAALVTGALLGVVALSAGALSGCNRSSAPATIPVATPAKSPAVTGRPDGTVLRLPGPGTAAVFDASTSSLVVLGVDAAGRSVVSVGPDVVALPSPATALTGDDAGHAYLSTRGGYFRLDIAPRAVTMVAVTGADASAGTPFTAIARRADGHLVLGTADGSVLTLTSPSAVGSHLKAFARVDQLVAQGNDVIVLDRGQTSVTEISGDHAAQALRAGTGATWMSADPAGRVLVTDTRGDGLLVFGISPLILRQYAPVPDSPYGIVGTSQLTWVSQTATNSVVGYDLSTGIPVEKARYRTVQQPNALAFDEKSGTLFVVSGSGAGAQAISTRR